MFGWIKSPPLSAFEPARRCGDTELPSQHPQPPSVSHFSLNSARVRCHDTNEKAPLTPNCNHRALLQRILGLTRPTQ